MFPQNASWFDCSSAHPQAQLLLQIYQQTQQNSSAHWCSWERTHSNHKPPHKAEALSIKAMAEANKILPGSRTYLYMSRTFQVFPLSALNGK